MTDVPQVFLNWLDFLCDPLGIAFDFKIILLLNNCSQLSGDLALLYLGQVSIQRREVLHDNLTTGLEQHLVSRWSHRQGFVNDRSVNGSEKVDKSCTIVHMIVNDYLWIDVSKDVVRCNLIREKNMHTAIGNESGLFCENFHLGASIIIGARTHGIDVGILHQCIEDSSDGRDADLASLFVE